MTLPHTARAAAFTLVEVLIATIVLGLGVLGLAALFAGAATQQQSAAAVSRSVAFSQEGMAVIGQRLGNLVSASGGQLPDGVWDALASDEVKGILRSRFAMFDKGDINGFGFLVPSTIGLTESLESLTPLMPGASVSLPDVALPHDRIWVKNGFRVVVQFGSDSPSFPRRTFEYNISLDDPAIQPFLDGDAPPPSEVKLWLDGVFDSENPLTLRTGFGGRGAELIAGADPITVPPGGAGPAGRWEFAFIKVGEYDWLNDTLASVNDRVLTIPSDTVPGGRLPVMGYSVLFRTLNVGVETTIFTYALTPLSAPRNDLDEQPFIPPDTRQDFQDDRSVLREIEVELARDQNTGQYYITTVDEEDDWVLSGGQVLVMSSKDGVANVPVGAGAEPDPGADSPVRVVTVRTVEDERRGVLDDSPRVNFRSVLEDPSQTQEIHVWAVAPIVESRSSDEGEWRLTPIEATTFKLFQ